MRGRAGFIRSGPASVFRLLPHLMIIAGAMLTHHAYGQEVEGTAAELAQPTPEADACSQMPLPLADCLELVSQISRFLDTAPAPQPWAPDDVAKTVCDRTTAPAPACLDTVARMKDWSDATFGSSTPPRSKKRHSEEKGPQWRAPSVGAYEGK